MKINRLNILRNNERIPIRKYIETRDKCNSVIRTERVNQTWRDIQEQIRLGGIYNIEIRY